MQAISLAIGSVPITIVACSSLLTDLLAEYFRYYRPQVISSPDRQAREQGGDIGIRIELRVLDRLSPREELIPPRAKLFSRTGIGGLWREKIEGNGSPAGERFYLEMGCAVFRVDPEAGHIDGFMTPCALERPHLLTNIYTLLPLLLLLRSRGIYHLQAAAVVSPTDKLWLICGAERAGKTTLTTALGLSGWRPVSDDSLLMGIEGATARITALKKHFHVERELLRRWSALESMKLDYQDSDHGRVGGLELFKTQDLADTGFERVDYLLLPQIVRQPESSLAPVAGNEAVLRLAEQSQFFQLWQNHVERQWGALIDLARGASCYRLFSGADMLDDPRRAAEILEQRIDA